MRLSIENQLLNGLEQFGDLLDLAPEEFRPTSARPTTRIAEAPPPTSRRPLRWSLCGPGARITTQPNTFATDDPRLHRHVRLLFHRHRRGVGAVGAQHGCPPPPAGDAHAPLPVAGGQDPSRRWSSACCRSRPCSPSATSSLACNWARRSPSPVLTVAVVLSAGVHRAGSRRISHRGAGYP